MSQQHPNRPTLLEIEREAKALRVPMTHVPRDPEYLSVLEDRIGQELTALEQRIAALRNLRTRVECVFGVQS
jgi:hypothetical protein